MPQRLYHHLPEYLMEALGLGLFMLSAALFGTALEAPGSLAREWLPDPLARRVVMGLCMGLTAVGLIYSPWGRRSGAHLNPAVTLTFLRLGRVAPADALGYVAAQFAGGAVGLMLAAKLLGEPLSAPPVRYVATLPAAGTATSFAAEIAISFGLMFTVLWSSNSARLERFTGLFAGCLVATWITFEAPISGMSMNPARSLASAVPAHLWDGLWIYFCAPPIGMLAAAELHRLLRGPDRVACAKLRHDDSYTCIFCEYHG